MKQSSWPGTPLVLAMGVYDDTAIEGICSRLRVPWWRWSVSTFSWCLKFNISCCCMLLSHFTVMAFCENPWRFFSICLVLWCCICQQVRYWCRIPFRDLPAIPASTCWAVANHGWPELTTLIRCLLRCSQLKVPGHGCSPRVDHHSEVSINLPSQETPLRLSDLLCGSAGDVERPRARWNLHAGRVLLQEPWVPPLGCSKIICREVENDATSLWLWVISTGNWNDLACLLHGSLMEQMTTYNFFCLPQSGGCRCFVRAMRTGLAPAQEVSWQQLLP